MRGGLKPAATGAAPTTRLAVEQMPPLGQPTRPFLGMQRYEVYLPDRGGASKLWVYLPEAATGKLPCILIAPAGSPLVFGMKLADGDQSEHLPYVLQGYAVVAYEISGPENKNLPDQQQISAVRQFKEAEGGIANARDALDYALARIPNIDPNRIYVAGHSSAATLALQVAENEPRIHGCIAYAPVCDLSNRPGDGVISELDGSVPGFRALMERINPITHAANLRCPLFLFHADDDRNVPTSDVARFYDDVRKTNKNVTFARVPTGGHYDSMLRQGIPQAIRWLKSL